MLSIRDGFDKGISPEILRHPANCKLLTNPKNRHKGRKSIITHEELMERIEIWNRRYGEFI